MSDEMAKALLKSSGAYISQWTRSSEKDNSGNFVMPPNSLSAPSGLMRIILPCPSINSAESAKQVADHVTKVLANEFEKEGFSIANGQNHFARQESEIGVSPSLSATLYDGRPFINISTEGKTTQQVQALQERISKALGFNEVKNHGVDPDMDTINKSLEKSGAQINPDACFIASLPAKPARESRTV